MTAVQTKFLESVDFGSIYTLQDTLKILNCSNNFLSHALCKHCVILSIFFFWKKKQVTLTLKKLSLEKDLQQKIFITTAFVTGDQFFCILITVILTHSQRI